MTVGSASLPGLHSPSAGFDQPLEMLGACHERVHRTLELLQRLNAHVAQHGVDADARSAATDVLRYFDLAAPHHHEDEERHVFPILQDHPDAAVREAVRTLQADHVLMQAIWQRVRPMLLRWQSGTQALPATEAERAMLRDFSDVYARHMALEDEVVYPAAATLLNAADLRAMGLEMAARRRQA